MNFEHIYVSLWIKIALSMLVYKKKLMKNQCLLEVYICTLILFGIGEQIAKETDASSNKRWCFQGSAVEQIFEQEIISPL